MDLPQVVLSSKVKYPDDGTSMVAANALESGLLRLHCSLRPTDLKE